MSYKKEQLSCWVFDPCISAQVELVGTSCTRVVSVSHHGSTSYLLHVLPTPHMPTKTVRKKNICHVTLFDAKEHIVTMQIFASSYHFCALKLMPIRFIYIGSKTHILWQICSHTSCIYFCSFNACIHGVSDHVTSVGSLREKSTKRTPPPSIIGAASFGAALTLARVGPS